jgi:nucleoside-diphosphate-sugar epimerase
VRVLVTGASGFIGSHVARRFAAGGDEVYALVRPPSFRLRLPGVTVVPGRLDREEALGYLGRLPELDVVCHLAADTRMDAAPEELEANVQGTRNLVAKLGEGLRGRRLLFASSIAAVDRKRYPRRPLTVEDPPAPRSAYAVSKLMCEELLEAEAEARGFALTVLRLGTIYGPGQADGGVVTLARAARESGMAARLPWTGRISFGYVEDVAEVYFRLAHAADAVTGTFFVSEGRGWTMAEAAEILREVQGAGKGPLPVPALLLRFANRLLWLPGIRRFAPWSLRAALADTILCDSEPIRRRLDLTWTPLPDGLRRTFG